ncbi:MAG: hypothetical protein ACYC9K_00865 [Sulfuricaulis sp.]
MKLPQFARQPISFRIQALKGIVPRTAARQLDPQHAQVAMNILTANGEAVPIKKPLSVTTVTKVGDIETMFRLTSGTQQYWLSWAKDVNVARSAIAGDVLQRLYYTGDNEPRMTTLADAINGGLNNYPSVFYVLGVFPPQTAPTVGAVVGGVGANESRTYVYTFQTQYGEESQPSPASTVVSGPNDGSWPLSNMDTAPPNSFVVTGASWAANVATLTVASTFGLRVNEEFSVSGMNPSGYNTASALITAVTSTQVSYALTSNPGAFVAGGTIARIAPHNTTGMVKNIYRASTGSYQFVAQIAVATTTYNDTTPTSALSTVVLPSLTWTMPPADMKAIVAMPNGMMAGLSGNIICFCEPFYHHAWPIAYQQPMNHTGVGLGVFGTSVVAATNGPPYVATGNTPSSVGVTAVEEVWPCLSKRGISEINDGANIGVLYPTLDGTALIGPNGAQIVSQSHYRLEDWQPLNPASMFAVTYANRYYVAFTPVGAAQQILIFDVLEKDLTQANVSINGWYRDWQNGQLYVAIQNGIYQWDADPAGNLTTDWKSKDFVFLPPINLGACKVDAEFTNTAAQIAALQAAYTTALAENKAIIGTATMTRTGTTVNGSAVVVMSGGTEGLIPGMSVTGAGIQAASYIRSIEGTDQYQPDYSPTSITLNKTATANGVPTLTFEGSAVGKTLRGGYGRKPYNKYAYARSAIRQLPAQSYDVCQFNLYHDGNLVFSKSLSSAKAFRLPSGYKSDNATFEVSANIVVKSIVYAETMDALRFS